jgi:hypothetical protein
MATDPGVLSAPAFRVCALRFARASRPRKPALGSTGDRLISCAAEGYRTIVIHVDLRHCNRFERSGAFKAFHYELPLLVPGARQMRPSLSPPLHAEAPSGYRIPRSSWRALVLRCNRSSALPSVKEVLSIAPWSRISEVGVKRRLIT